MALQPLDDRVVVEIEEAESKTQGGIVLPETAKEKPKEGEVIELGSGRLLDDGKRAPFTVQKGDRVIFSSYAGTEVKIDGEEYLILSEDEILVIVK